jgi:hypothetical protein
MEEFDTRNYYDAMDEASEAHDRIAELEKALSDAISYILGETPEGREAIGRLNKILDGAN